MYPNRLDTKNMANANNKTQQKAVKKQAHYLS